MAGRNQSYALLDIQRRLDEGYRLFPTSQLPHLPPKLYDFNNVVHEAKVSQRCDFKLLKDLVPLLTLDHWEKINRYPQLGNFLYLYFYGYFKGIVVHQIMLRACVKEEGKSVYELWFVVNGKPIRLSPEEFSLVSGLKFGQMSRDDLRNRKKSKFKKKTFPRSGDFLVKVEEVEQEIRRLIRRSTDSDDIIKLLFVLVVSCIILPTRAPRYVEDWIFDTCDYLDICDIYPWGEKAWTETCQDILKKVGPLDGGDLRRWNVNGFGHIVLYWLFESVEGLAAECHCGIRQDFVGRHPRMLRWMTDKGNRPNYETVNDFLDRVTIVIPRLKPDAVEAQSEYYVRAVAKLGFSNNETGHDPNFLTLLTALGPDHVVVQDDVAVPTVSAQGGHRRRSKRPRDGASTSRQPPPSPQMNDEDQPDNEDEDMRDEDESQYGDQSQPRWARRMEHLMLQNQRVFVDYQRENNRHMDGLTRMMEDLLGRMDINFPRPQTPGRSAATGVASGEGEEDIFREVDMYAGVDPQEGDHLHDSQRDPHEFSYNPEADNSDSDNVPLSDIISRIRKPSKFLRTPFTANDKPKRSSK